MGSPLLVQYAAAPAWSRRDDGLRSDALNCARLRGSGFEVRVRIDTVPPWKPGEAPMAQNKAGISFGISANGLWVLSQEPAYLLRGGMPAAAEAHGDAPRNDRFRGERSPNGIQGAGSTDPWRLAPVFLRGPAARSRLPCPKTKLKCPLYSAPKPARVLAQAGIGSGARRGGRNYSEGRSIKVPLNREFD